MTGSLVEKNSKYYVVVRIPDSLGELKQKWINTGVLTSGNNKREAKRRMNEILAEIEQKKITYSPDILFIDWLDKWMEQKKNEVRLNTYEAYESYLNNHIIPFLKPLKLTLQSINGQHIQDYYNRKIKEGLSVNSVHRHNAVIRGALQEAIKKNLIPYNPVDRATLPARKRFVGSAYSVKQANQLLSVITDEPIKPAVILGLFYGLRRSEVCGLRWRDIDFSANTIRICNTVVKNKTLIEHEQTKSRASNRTMYIIPETRGYLLNLRQKQKETAALFSNICSINDHVCIWADGRPLAPDYISRGFASLLKKHNLPPLRFHELRHSCASLLLEKGLSAKQIQEYLGHERVSTTLDIYGHLSIEGKKEAANTMDGLLTLEKKQKIC